LSLSPLWVTRTTLWYNSYVFWDVMTCSPLKINWCISGTCHCHLQGQRKASSPCYLVHTGFVLGLFFNPEAGGDMFVCNSGWLPTDYMTLCVRRYEPLLWEPQSHPLWFHFLVVITIFIHELFVDVDTLCSPLFLKYLMMNKFHEPIHFKWIILFRLSLS
jgi:hypothetical protein